MIITNMAIDRSTTVFVLLALIFVTGVFSYIVLPRESSPEVVVPIIIVTTTYEGVAPSDMESLVTVPIERKLTGLSDVKKIESTSIEGVSSIVIEFEADSDIDSALQKVRDKVDQAKQDLPQDADDPVINEVNISEFPILVMSLTGNYPIAVLNEIAEDIEDDLETVRGVLDVAVVGGVEREIQIIADPARIAEYGISFADLIQVTQLENVNTPGGSMDLGEAKYLMRTPGEFKTPEDLEGLIVKMGPAGNVYLRDVAEVRDGFKDQATISRTNGTPSVTITLSKRAGANIVDMARDVKEALRRMEDRFPAGVEVGITWDESVYITDMVSDLENSVLSGLLLVLIVIFIFLGFTNAVMVSLAIPVSMLITFTVLYMSGVTLNMVVLFSLILALGMLVDNGIVVVENIYRHVQEGEERHLAAKRGAAEVAWPIIGSTFTTLAAFFPMFFWPGIFGEFMIYLPMTVSISLFASLFVGIIVNPALASAMMRRHEKNKRRGGRHPILHTYEKVLRIALAWRGVTFALAIASLVIIVALFAADATVVFLPETEPPQAFVRIECPEGTNLDTSDRFVRQVERIVEAYRENLDYVIANVGSEGAGPGVFGSGNATHISQVTLDFPKLEDCTIPPSRVLELIREDLGAVTGAEVRINQMDMGPPTGPPVNVEISGDDYEVLARLALEARELIRDVPGLVDLRDDYSQGQPELRVVVDRQQAWRTGLNTQLVGITVQAAINGRKAADFRDGDNEYDVTVRFPESFRADITNIESMNLINLAGEPVPFSAVARLEQGTGLGSIKRINRKRTVTVSAEVTRDRTAPEVLADVQAILGKQLRLPSGYTVAYTGENEDSEETQVFLLQAFVIAVFLVTMVLVTQFNSVTKPLIIMTSVILSLGGVFLGLLLFDMPFGILMTGIGCISLAGVVVNNAIVLIDFIDQLRETGMPVREAIVQAGVVRFRPVMLTAITTVLGLVPMAAGVSVDFRALFTGRFADVWRVGGENSQFWGSMAIAVIFGLSFATVLTLVVVPALYSFTHSIVHNPVLGANGTPESAGDSG
jgi:multidrug efflux pump